MFAVHRWLTSATCTGKGGKGGGDDAPAAPVSLPDLEAVKADMMSHVDRLKKSLVKLRGGESNPSTCRESALLMATRVARSVRSVRCVVPTA